MIRNDVHRRGFTLIELLVVVAIIIALLAILMPSMGKALRAAQRVQCGSGLHQWGIALLSTAADNAGKLRSSSRGTAGEAGSRYPNNIWYDNRYPEDWSIPLLADYLSGVDLDNKRLGDAWHCATAIADGDMAVHDDHWLTVGATYGYVNLRYSIFTGVDQWTAAASPTAQRELVGSRPGGSGQVMMSDAMFKWTYGGWVYNHGLTSASAHYLGQGFGYVDAGPPQIEGAHNMFGDLSVQWKDAGEYDTAAMQAINASLGFVRGGASDTNFY